MRPYLRVANVFEDRIDTSDVMTMHFEPQEFERYRLLPGDVLLNEGQSPELLGRPALYRGTPADVAFTNSLIRFRPHPGVEPEWALTVFRHYMWSGRFTRESRITTNIAHLSANRFKTVEFPVPPVEEQRRITTALAAHLSGVDAALEPQDLLTAKLSATRGRILDEAIAGCDTFPLRELLNAPLSNGRSVRTQAGGFPVLRLTALRGGRIALAEQKEGAWTVEEAKPWLVEEGDFLVARGNGSLRLVGRGGLVGPVSSPVAYPDTLIRVRPDAGRCDPEYLRLVWDSRVVRRQIESVARTTAGIYKVNQKHLEALELPVPELDRQRSIVRAVTNAWATIDLAQDRLKVVRAKTAALRRSLLAAAVAGRTVAQDPSDEHADLLLKRIAEDLAAATPTARRGRARTVPSARTALGTSSVEESA
jgi:type I restriction enzyme S subunit